ncbi:MAG: NAD(P)H-dependent glycerol-3-phosphate dehydrogenase [Pseudomonadota bacterium]
MIAILGGGAFGTSLACAVPGPIHLWGRGLEPGARSSARLPGVSLPAHVTVCATVKDAVAEAQIILVAVPMSALRKVLSDLPETSAPIIACCKGIEPETGHGPVGIIRATRAGPAGILTGPSFAAEIAQGLPTALTLAMTEPNIAQNVQNLLSGPSLRIYQSRDVRGAELGGALKNVLAIAAGAVIGAGLGQSAQAALLTRGFSELTRLARAEGAEAQTLRGLSGFGDLMLTAFSDQSRNYRYGIALGRGARFDEDTTVEGVATARAVARLAHRHGLDLPVLSATQRLISGDLAIKDALDTLMSRPLKEE